MPGKPTIVLDVDGTLVDTNYQHAIAWHRAFREHGFRVAIWEIHRHIGMGGDQLVESLVGEEGENECGDELRDAHSEAYSKLIGETEAMEGASELIAELDDAGATVILASSAQREELDHYVQLLGAGERIAGATSSADAERTKPHPELVQTALDKYGNGGPALMIGDSTWDVKAAKAAGVPTLALLTGGFSEAELREAGAAEVKRSLAQLREEGVDAVLALAGEASP
ncbi:MAG TPA: HAD family hydrolase [Solirubrobacterales bacterium]|jgi:HAD superfamily hydrolase (TIGR01549 family)|nr:HAD family hydrolase [Solirubrobacterales bacterium]